MTRLCLVAPILVVGLSMALGIGEGARRACASESGPAKAEAARVGAVAPAGTTLREGTTRTWRSDAGGPELLWTGFHVTREGGEISIQTSAPVVLEPLHTTSHTEPSGTTGPAEAMFVIKHCRAIRRTDRLPLETRFFDSPVTRVAVTRRGVDLRLVVSLRQAVNVVTHREPGPAGSWFWVLTFPRPGQDGPLASAVPAAPPK